MLGGLNGNMMLIGLLVGIAVLLGLVLFTKIHAFLALIISCLVIGAIGGIPLVAGNAIVLEGGKKLFVMQSITNGFGGTLGSIGMIIGFGVMMGQIFEATGAAKRMALTFLKLFGKNHEEAALAATGYLVSIPIFCDSGFIVLAPIAKAISKATKKSVITLGVALAAGLVITHSLVPPTPGPLGVCGIYGIEVGKFILFGLVLSLPMTIACMLYGKWVGKRIYKIPDDTAEDGFRTMKYQEPDYSQEVQLAAEKLPSTFESFAPLIVPIVLILLSTITSALKVSNTAIQFLGTPIIAVGLGLVIAILTLARPLEKTRALKVMEKGMSGAGIIMLVTGGGGALGQIIKDSGLGSYMATGLAEAGIPIIILPFIVATVIRFIQGSGTVAMITAATITAPIVASTQGSNPYLAALACCVGSLFFSYFNDSYFWVVNRTLGNSNTKDQIMTYSIASTVAWAVGFIEVMILSIIF